jgi:hypothetical protein
MKKILCLLLAAVCMFCLSTLASAKVVMKLSNAGPNKPDNCTAAVDEGRYAAYLERWVYGKNDQAERLAEVGGKRLAAIQADPRTGYATGLQR